MYLFTILLTIASNAVYHVVQQVTPRTSNPVLSLALTYVVAAGICLILLFIFPVREGLQKSLREMNWTSLVLALPIVGLEVGFLLAYRAGWNISLGAIFSNVAVALILLPVGVLLFRERISNVNYLGIGVCILGIVLTNWR